MPPYIEINGKTYHKRTLQLILGKHHIEQETLQPEYQLLAEAIEHPLQLPYLIEQIYRLDIQDEDAYRFALLRVQIDADLRMSEDIPRYQQQKYIAQVIERIIYGNLMLEDHPPTIEEDDEYMAG
jgi:phage-related minor tail protein